MNRPRIVLSVGLATSLVSILVTMASTDAVRSALSRAHDYPNDAGMRLDDAASWTMTYLFTIAGGSLIVVALYLLIRPLATSRVGWWIGAALVVVGLILSIYNSTQEFPLRIKVVFYLPMLVGITWLALPEAGRLAMHSGPANAR